MIDVLRPYKNLVAGGIALCVFFPLFFQIDGGIFRDRSMIFDPHGMVSKVPLPVSLLACLAGTLLIGQLRYMLRAIVVICSSFLLMMITSLIASGDIAQSTLVLGVQFLVPMSALVLGGLYYTVDGDLRILSVTFVGILWIIMPAQLICSWIQGGSSSLWPGLYLFSIYQHLQYVPFIFACGFVLALFARGRDPRIGQWTLWLSPILALYLVVASSITGISLVIAGVILWFCLYGRNLLTRRFVRLLGVLVLVIILISAYVYSFRNYSMVGEKLGIHQQTTSGTARTPLFEKRLAYWKLYGNAVTRDVRSFLTGNASTPDRNKYPGPHNYYLDLVYHFGALSSLPLLVLTAVTLWQLWRQRKTVCDSPHEMGLSVVILFVLLVENMVKVGLRQPYPGIFAFFLWGILLSRLSVFPTGSFRRQLLPDSLEG